MNTLAKFVIVFAASLMLNACAPEISYTPAPLLFPEAATVDGSADVTLPVAVQIHLNTGYSRELPAQSRWRRAGHLPEGNVYRPVASVFTVEGHQVHEAYLVIRGNMLVGFYLPVESGFSPLTPPVQLPQGVFQ